MVIFFNKYTETAPFSGAPEFIPVFSVIRVALSFSFLFSVLYILFVLLSFCLLHCLSFDLKISITPFGIFKLFLYFTSYMCRAVSIFLPFTFSMKKLSKGCKNK